MKMKWIFLSNEVKSSFYLNFTFKCLKLIYFHPDFYFSFVESLFKFGTNPTLLFLMNFRPFH
jgi:hypothetical protein